MSESTDSSSTQNTTSSAPETAQNGTPAKKMSRSQIVPFSENDIEEVVELSMQYFPHSQFYDPQFHAETFRRLYFTKQNSTTGISPLVSRASDGSINGFLGALPKIFDFKGQQVLAAHSHHMVATEKGRARLVPIRMIQKFFEGPQDFSFADGAVESSRLLWNRLGGCVTYGDSIYYKVPLRPVSFGTRVLQNKLPNGAYKAVSMLSGGTDGAAKLLRIPLFSRRNPDTKLVDLTPELLMELLANVKPHYSLFPQHTVSEIEHLFELMSRDSKSGHLQKKAIFDVDEKLIGWFIYFSNNKGICEVIQAVGVPGKENLLFKALTWHAFNEGGIELSGRLMPEQLRTSFTRSALSFPGRMWTLVHSHNSELKLEIQAGNAFFTRLEGDLWLL